jgi:hypothetical protein
MLKKILVSLVILLVVLSCAAVLALRKTPVMLETLLERELQKDVVLEGVSYRFPLNLSIEKFSILEKGPFKGEASFYAENMIFDVNLAAFLSRQILINEIRLKKPTLIVRKLRRDVVHAFSSPKPSTVGSKKSSVPTGETKKKGGAAFSLKIASIIIDEGVLKWIDYDISDEGFVLQVQNISSKIQNFTFPPTQQPVDYDLEARVVQGRQHSPATLSLKGWTQIDDLETRANGSLKELWIPYFEPYYRKVTSARVRDGLLDVTSTHKIENRDLTSNSRADIRRLSFDAFEQDNEIFGMDAELLLNLLKNQSGGLTLDLVIRWDMKDPQSNFKSVLRKSISHSLQSTLVNNFQNIVGNTLDKLSDKLSDKLESQAGGQETGKPNWKGLLDKIQEVIE